MKKPATGSLKPGSLAHTSGHVFGEAFWGSPINRALLSSPQSAVRRGPSMGIYPLLVWRTGPCSPVLGANCASFPWWGPSGWDWATSAFLRGQAVSVTSLVHDPSTRRFALHWRTRHVRPTVYLIAPLFAVGCRSHPPSKSGRTDQEAAGSSLNEATSMGIVG